MKDCDAFTFEKIKSVGVKLLKAQMKRADMCVVQMMLLLLNIFLAIHN
jgi:hypothetical protein